MKKSGEAKKKNIQFGGHLIYWWQELTIVSAARCCRLPCDENLDFFTSETSTSRNNNVIKTILSFFATFSGVFAALILVNHSLQWISQNIESSRYNEPNAKMNLLK